MSRIGKMFGKLARRSASAPSVNREGHPAWARSIEEQYLQTLLTNTFGQAFYASARELAAEAAQVHDAMLAKDPAFAAKALAFARNRGFMRAQPVFGLAKLAQLAGTYFESVFAEVVRTPNDLADFTTVMKSLRASEGGRRVKRVAGKWLLANLSEYWVMKYGAQKDGGYSLRDLLRIYHPNAGARLPIIDYLLGKPADLAALPQLAALEVLKWASSDEEKVAAIEAGRLPHEVVTPFAHSAAVWASLVPQLPIFALLRNLATLERRGVLEASRSLVERKLGDGKIIGNSKILPFRFLEAEKHVQAAWAKDALRDAVELSFANVPELDGRTAVFLDRSGSMQSYLQTAAIFAVSLLKKARLDGRLLLYDDRLEEIAVSMRDSVLTQAGRVTARGGTDTALPMRQLLSERDRVDNIILISDEQQNAGTPFIDVLDEYRRKVNAQVKAFIVDVAPYRNALVPSADPLSWYIYGWSDQAMSFVSMASRGFGGMVESVRNGIN